jgi:hypothetical protein
LPRCSIFTRVSAHVARAVRKLVIRESSRRRVSPWRRRDTVLVGNEIDTQGDEP